MPSQERQRALARAKLERQMARRAEAARRRRQLQAALGAVVALVVVVGGTALLVNKFSGSDTKKDTASAPASPDCTYSKSSGGKVKDVGTPPTSNVPRTGARTATVTTNEGTLEFSLDTAKAPCTSNSFEFLAGKKYFDGTSCHRLTTSGIFVLQCGDPSATGTGGPGYQFAEENLPGASGNNYPAGVLAMANGGPGTNGSQFFIVYKDTHLEPNYTIFGKVTKGLDVVTKVAAAGESTGKGDGSPKKPVKIEKVTVSPVKS